MSKGKLQKFKELQSFSNVLQPSFNEVFQKDFYLKGKWSKNFFTNDHPVVLELGCGKGEYTLALAKQYPEYNIIGIDIKGARIWKGAKAAIYDGIENAAFLRTRIDFIQSFFAHREVKEIWITFPDPQPQKKLKRLTSSRFLNHYRQFLMDGGLVHLKTDSKELFQYTKNLAEYNRLPLIYAIEDLYSQDSINPILATRTYYENIWLDAGLPINYLCFKIFSESSVIEIPDGS